MALFRIVGCRGLLYHTCKKRIWCGNYYGTIVELARFKEVRLSGEWENKTRQNHEETNHHTDLEQRMKRVGKIIMRMLKGKRRKEKLPKGYETPSTGTLIPP